MTATPAAGPTLADVPVGTRVVLGRPGGTTARARRLAELGLRAGARVHVVQRTAGGGRLVAVEDARIALDRGTLRLVPVVRTEDARPNPTGAA